MSEYFVYITCPTEKEAEAIGAELVRRRLVACVNILPGMRSLYWWQGKVQQGNETVLIAKTRRELVGELTEAVKSMHSFEVPCVVALKIEGGSQDFIDWIRTETKAG
ncbi:divalent-cation tolerance protein CutA [Pseudodesulfovibrio sp.]|uniref:divalent-cation tolerance protein CutA n=1 Tax=unclassified Pseudodesulfovibrio TaxID=2661612 RepID=UPI003AFF8B88